MGLCKDPPPPQARCIPIRKELIHWYFSFPQTSRILPSLADFSPGRSRAAVRAAVPVCGGTALSSPISPVVLKRCICAAFAAPTAAALSVSAPAAFFRRIRSSILEVLLAITSRCRTGRWRPDLPRGRQRQWWRRMHRLLLALFGCSHGGCGLDNFRRLIRSNIIPVTTAGKKENRTVR